MAKSAKKGAMPTKQTMNLYYKPDRTTGPATAALYILFAATVLLALFKFGVYDQLQKVHAASERLRQAQAQEQEYLAQLSDYDQVLHQYHLYAATEEELSIVDRMEILALLDEYVRPSAEVISVSISADTVIVRMSNVTLGETAEIVRALRNDPLVDTADVNTAATDGTSDPAQIVTAGITITLAKEVG